jgi:hypothetical protein
MHLQVCEEKEKEGNTRARSLASPRQAGPAVARQWVRVHDVCVNSSLKSDPKPRSPAASFCHLFLLRVRV